MLPLSGAASWEPTLPCKLLQTHRRRHDIMRRRAWRLWRAMWPMPELTPPTGYGGSHTQGSDVAKPPAARAHRRARSPARSCARLRR
eukprot:scaffold1533_cov111-Isochrysis_galbana.AAC.4